MLCRVEGCLEAQRSKGLCGRHYIRERKFGSPTGTAVKPLDERFWAMVDRRGDDECWSWQGWSLPPRGSNKRGYGLFTVNGKRMLAHRFAWLLAEGYIPDGLVVCHHCDDPSCVNRRHLFVGSQRDNMRDMAAKGRARNDNTKWERCKAGHEITGRNAVVQPSGRVRCRICKNRLSREWAAAKRTRESVAGISITGMEH